MRSFPLLLVLLCVGSAWGQNAPIVSGTQAPVNIGSGGASLSLPLADKFALEDVTGPIARFTLVTGTIDVELFPEVAPITVANFRKYVSSGAYNLTFIHRSIAGFVIQGGGYTYKSTGLTSIKRLPPIKNEYQRPNAAGTLSMAKVAGNLDSASSEWFFNLVDNTFLNESPDAYYTVFGRTLTNGLDEAVKISNLPTANAGGVLANVPLYNYTSGTATTANLVWLLKAQELPLVAATGTGYLTLSATSSNSSLVTAVISKGKLALRSVGTALGSAEITVNAADRFGRSAQLKFNANVVNTMLPVISLKTLAGDAAENSSSTGMVRIQRTGSKTYALNVALSLNGSTATNGVDFVAIPTVVTIPAGAGYLDLPVAALSDDLKEGIELVELSISGSSSYTVAAGSRAEIRLLDDDVPNVSLSAIDPLALKGAPQDTATVRFTRTGPTTEPLSVPFTFSGDAELDKDFSAPASPLVIPVGESYADLVLTPKSESDVEGWQRLIVQATSGTYANLLVATAVVGLGESDLPTITQSIADGIAAETGPDSARVVFTRTGSTTAPLTIFFKTGGTATNGIDYKLLPKAVTIPAGATEVSVVITPIDDTIKDPSETVVLTLVPTAYYNAVPGSSMITIQDND